MNSAESPTDTQTEPGSFDSIIDEENSGAAALTISQPDHESLRSFWVGWVGVAVLTHFLVFLTVNVWASHWFCGIVVSTIIDTPFTARFWDAEQTLELAMGWVLVPSLVVSAIVPMLYWRGHLLLRFALSISLAIAMMNISAEIGHNRLRLNLAIHGAILASWISLPALLHYAPIRTKTLRGLAICAILILVFCLSMLTLSEAPRNTRFLYWESLFGTTLLICLLGRNWGKHALLEGNATADKIERTSTLTLMELMLVCSLACLASLYWSARIDLGESLHLASASLLAVGSLMASLYLSKISCYKTLGSFKRVGLLVGVWFFMTLILSVATFGYAVKGPTWRSWSSTLNASHFLVFGTSFSGLIFLLFNWLLHCWLAYCGWSWSTTKDRPHDVRPV